MNIMYVALHIAHVYDNTFMQRQLMQSFTYIYGSGGKGPKTQSFVLQMKPFNNFYIDRAQAALDIFPFALFRSPK